MSVKKDASGRRSVQVEVEVPGTPEEYLYGDQAADTVARETPLWQAWVQERFPMPSETSAGELG